MFYEVLASCRAVAPGKPFRFKNPLYSLDATVIDLCVTMFDWAKYVRTKGAIKLHLLLDHDGYLPAYAYLTEGKVHDIRVARILELPAGSIVAMDRGYHDFALFLKWTQAGIWFVSRLRASSDYCVREERKLPRHRNILADQIIEFTGARAEQRGITHASG